MRQTTIQHYHETINYSVGIGFNIFYKNKTKSRMHPICLFNQFRE